MPTACCKSVPSVQSVSKVIQQQHVKLAMCMELLHYRSEYLIQILIEDGCIILIAEQRLVIGVWFKSDMCIRYSYLYRFRTCCGLGNDNRYTFYMLLYNLVDDSSYIYLMQLWFQVNLYLK